MSTNISNESKSIDTKDTCDLVRFAHAYTYLFLFISFTLFTLVPLCAHAQVNGDDDAAVERLIAQIAASREPDSFLLEDAPDSGAPVSCLHAILAEIDRLGPGKQGHVLVPPAAYGHLTNAERKFRKALQHMTSSSSDLNAALIAIQAGVAALTKVHSARGRPLQPKLAELAKKAVAAARQTASDVVDLAASGGADPNIVARAQAALASGDLAIQQGNPVQAVALFQQSFDLAANVITFHIEVFEQNILDALAGQTIGYAYSIGLNGVLFNESFDGLSRTMADGMEISQSPTKEMYIASMSKTISAVALLELLNEEGISVNESISDYLPADWTQGPNLEDVTFRRLLTHRSGLDAANVSCCGTAGQTLASLQSIIAAGSTGASDNQPSVYTNANFSLLRILIPQIANGPGVIANWANIWPLDAVYAARYSIYVDNNVLAPAGINKLTCAPDEDPEARTLLYSVNAPNGMGLDPGDWSLSCGATGWYLSANELASFLAFLRFTNEIIGPATRELMDELFLGWLDPVAFAGFVQGTFGVYRAHGGDYQSGNRGMTGCMMNFHINVQTSLVINSVGGNLGGHACTLLKDAFDAAWF